MNTVGIRFNRRGKIYGFRAEGLGLRRGELVVVESELGMSIGRVVKDGITVEDEGKAVKEVMRRATTDDFLQEEENLALRAEARSYFNERVVARGLGMKLIDTDVTLDRKRIIFYFVSESRIDFRELVKDLAAKFKTRIELRQIGVRDAAQMIGGLGICGRQLCCRSFLTSFEPISIKMAKRQELVLNTSKLSGLCGRLMCCLSYERGKETFEDIPMDSAPEDIETETEETAPASAAIEAGEGPDEAKKPETPERPPQNDTPAVRSADTPAVQSAPPGTQTKPGGSEHFPRRKKFFRRKGGHGPHKRG